MVNYEIMFLVNPNLSEEQKKSVFAQLDDVVVKNGGEIVSSGVWSEKRKLAYPIKKFQEALYYLTAFRSLAEAIAKLKQAYRLNENVIRLMVVRGED